MEAHTAPVALLDPDRLGREALVSALTREGIAVATSAATPRDLLDALASCPAALALLQVDAVAEAALLAALRALRPPVPALILGGRPELGRAQRSYRQGAAGYLARQATGMEGLCEAIRAALRGEPCFPWGEAAPPLAEDGADAKLRRLTLREREVLAQVAAGHDNLKIAALLNISERTVKSHVISVYRKLDAENRVQLALLANELGVLPAIS